MGPMNVSSSNPISAEHYYRNKSLLPSHVGYEDFFGLRENPFSLTPDPRYLFRTRHAHDTLRQLTRAILGRKRLILLTGEVGTGKTTVLNSALQTLRENPGREGKTRTAVLVHPTLTREEFVEAVLNDFRVRCEATRKPRRLQVLQEMLSKVRQNGGLAVLAIDEAQLLPCEVLDEVRTLLSLRNGSEELLQVILCGQPEIEARLGNSHFASLQPLVTVRCLTALSFPETRDYIQHRMRIAGAKSESIFTVDAAKAVHHHSRGIPRLVNLLCWCALASAGARGLFHITARVVNEAAEKMMPFPDGKPPGPRPRMRNPDHHAPANPCSAPDAPADRPPAAKSANEPTWQVAAPIRRIAQLPPSRKGAPLPIVSVEPRTRNRVSAPSRMSERASEWLDRWWSTNFSRNQYPLALANVAVLGMSLLALAQIPVSAETWQHTTRAAFGFVGLLLLDIALGLAAYLFLWEGRRNANASSATNRPGFRFRRVANLFRGTAASQ